MNHILKLPHPGGINFWFHSQSTHKHVKLFYSNLWVWKIDHIFWKNLWSNNHMFCILILISATGSWIRALVYISIISFHCFTCFVSTEIGSFSLFLSSIIFTISLKILLPMSPIPFFGDKSHPSAMDFK